LFGATMVDLVSAAYGVKPEAVAGGPSWLEWNRFDVIAKAPNDLTGEPLKAALRTLLAERFGLAVHQDGKPMSAWLLTARKNPRMKQSDRPEADDRETCHTRSGDRSRGTIAIGVKHN